MMLLLAIGNTGPGPIVAVLICVALTGAALLVTLVTRHSVR
jgi:hypothetical protein